MRILRFSLFFGALITIAGATAYASSVSGINVGSGDLDQVITSLGVNTNFKFDTLLGALLKFGGAYTIAHSVYELHDVWKQAQYRLKDFTHLLTGAGGTGIAVGGLSYFISSFLGSGQGSLLH